jgi:hypothetical protein
MHLSKPCTIWYCQTCRLRQSARPRVRGGQLLVTHVRRGLGAFLVSKEPEEPPVMNVHPAYVRYMRGMELQPSLYPINTGDPPQVLRRQNRRLAAILPMTAPNQRGDRCLPTPDPALLAARATLGSCVRETPETSSRRRPCLQPTPRPWGYSAVARGLPPVRAGRWWLVGAGLCVPVA